MTDKSRRRLRRRLSAALLLLIGLAVAGGLAATLTPTPQVAVADESASALPLIVGGDAPSHASALLSMLATHPDLAKRVQASNWIGSRRWDLKMDNGVEVKLPEDGVAEALQQLADAEASSRVLERDVAIIDLRLAGKMIVRLAHDLPPPAKTKPQQGI